MKSSSLLPSPSTASPARLRRAAVATKVRLAGASLRVALARVGRKLTACMGAGGCKADADADAHVDADADADADGECEARGDPLMLLLPSRSGVQDDRPSLRPPASSDEDEDDQDDGNDENDSDSDSDNHDASPGRLLAGVDAGRARMMTRVELLMGNDADFPATPRQDHAVPTRELYAEVARVPLRCRHRDVGAAAAMLRLLAEQLVRPPH
jgi:hypothetical protein